MTPSSHDDLQRSLGRVEGNQDAMDARMDRFEKLVSDGFAKIDGALTKLDKRLAEIETVETERKVERRFGAWLAGIVGGCAAIAIEFVLSHFWK